MQTSLITPYPLGNPLSMSCGTVELPAELLLTICS